MIKKTHSILLLLGLSSSLVAQDFQPGVTEYGHPDFRGVWNFSNTTPLERPERFGDRELLTDKEIAQQAERGQASAIASQQREANVAERVMNTANATSAGSVNSFWMERTARRVNPRTSLIVHPKNGRLPALQAELEIQRGDQNGIREIPGERPVRYTHGGIARNGPEDRGLSERCLVFNSGPPLLSGPYNNNIQIFQNAAYVVILTEMGFDARIVPLHSNPQQAGEHIDERITLWSGDSRGHFDGNTLVVETRNFNDQIASLGLRDKAYGSAINRTLIEKFRLTGTRNLDYEFTIDDASTFSDKITVVMPMTKTDDQIYEYACHAGNYAMGNILKGARVEDGSN